MKVRLFPGIVFGLLGLNVAIVATTVYCATGDPSFAVDPAYYHQTCSTDPAAVHMVAESETAQPAWRIGVSAGDFDGTPDRFLTLELSDERGRSLESSQRGVLITAQAFHNARAGQPVDLTFEPLGVGTGRYSCRLRSAMPGRWTLRLSIAAGDEQWNGTRGFVVSSPDAQRLFNRGKEAGTR